MTGGCSTFFRPLPQRALQASRRPRQVKPQWSGESTAMTNQTAPARRPRLVTALLGLAAVLTLFAVIGGWGWGRLNAGLPGAKPQVPAARADAIARQLETAFGDAEAAWKRASDKGAGGRWMPARLVLFTGSTASPCAGGTLSGSFYCAETGTAAFDLAFLASLEGRLQREAERGTALVAGRIAAEHYQRETGILDAVTLALIAARRSDRDAIRLNLALQADCLTGAWAAGSGLAPLPEDLWFNVVTSSRNIVDEMAGQGVRIPREFDLFAPGTREARVAAFEAGYVAANPSVCPDPAAQGTAG